MQKSEQFKVIDMFTRTPVDMKGHRFKNQDMAERILKKLRRLEKLDEYSLDVTDVYLTGMLNALERSAGGAL